MNDVEPSLEPMTDLIPMRSQIDTLESRLSDAVSKLREGHEEEEALVKQLRQQREFNAYQESRVRGIIPSRHGGAGLYPGRRGRRKQCGDGMSATFWEGRH